MSLVPGRGAAVRLKDFELVAAQGDIDTQGDEDGHQARARQSSRGHDVARNRVPGWSSCCLRRPDQESIVHLAPGQTVQAWVQNKGEALPTHRARGGGGAPSRGRAPVLMESPVPRRRRSRPFLDVRELFRDAPGPLTPRRMCR